MSIFDSFKNNDSILNKEDVIIEKKEINIFDIIKNLYSLLYKLSDRNKLKNEIEKITIDCSDSDLSFISWIISHNLCYNKFTRKNIDTFVKISYSLNSIDYIQWYFDFMFSNKIRFPAFMPWYKFNSNINKIKDKIKEEYNLDDEELNEVLEYTNLSLRDIWMMIENV